jgi:HSP20 family molecular chaperone IbpA
MIKRAKTTFNTEKFIENLNSIAAKKICDAYVIKPMELPRISDIFDYRTIVPRPEIEGGDAATKVIEHLDDRLVYYFNVAGFKKDKLEINIKDSTLIVTGKDGGLQGLSRTEHSFTLPKDVDLEKTSVELEDGILRISIGKKTNRITKLHIK